MFFFKRLATILNSWKWELHAVAHQIPNGTTTPTPAHPPPLPQMHKPKSTFALFQHFAELVLHQSKRCIHSGKVLSKEKAIAGIVLESKQEEKFRVTEVWNWEKLDAVSAETAGGRVDFRSFSFRPIPFLVIKKACTVRVWRSTVSVTTTCFKDMLNNQIMHFFFTPKDKDILSKTL